MGPPRACVVLGARGGRETVSGASVGDFCVDRGWITREQLARVEGTLAADCRAWADALVARGLITERERAEALGAVWGIPLADLDEDTLNPDEIRELLRSLPAAHYRCLRALPFRRSGGRVLVAMADPLDVAAVGELDYALGRQARIAPYIAAEGEILATLARVAPEEGPGREALDAILRLFEE